LPLVDHIFFCIGFIGGSFLESTAIIPIAARWNRHLQISTDFGTSPDGGAIVGLCYAYLDQELDVWEFGGLCVDEDVDHDIVSVLAGLAVI
jgi:hypothetical protein